MLRARRRVVLYREVIQLCKLYDPIDKRDKVNCINCHRWTGKRCRDEDELLAEEQSEHGAMDRMMRGNRGVWIE